MKTKHIYLTAFYLQRPKDPSKTHIKGYITDPNNMVWDENVEINNGLSSKDRAYAQIVLDLSEKIVVTNKLNDEKDFNTLFKYFFEGYHKYITQVMTQLDPGYLAKIVDELEAELTNEPQDQSV